VFINYWIEKCTVKHWNTALHFQRNSFFCLYCVNQIKFIKIKKKHITIDMSINWKINQVNTHSTPKKDRHTTDFVDTWYLSDSLYENHFPRVTLWIAFAYKHLHIYLRVRYWTNGKTEEMLAPVTERKIFKHPVPKLYQ